MTEEEKQEILGNIEMITAKDLANYIVNKQISIEEMMETGELDVAKRIEVTSIAEAEINRLEKEKEERERVEKERLETERLEKIAQEKIDWESISKSNNTNKIEQFLQNYPDGNFFKDAVDLLVEVENNQKDKIQILNNIKENSNKYTPDSILEFLEKEIISKEELLSTGIPKIIIENLNKENKELVLGKIPDQIENGYTEVYFWGLPGSGKTCALSAILSTGVKLGDIDPQIGLGQHYMSQLSNIFLSKCSVLPPSTHVEYTQYLPFDITDNNKVKHPIALVELSGEVFRAFYKDQNDLPLDDQLLATLERTKEYLKGPNKKIHFFIMDITRDPSKPDRENVTQQQYLRSMTSYLDLNNIFKNTTDGVYIITTKSDVLSVNPDNRKDLALEHLNKNYKSFINSLKDLLSKNKLSNHLNVIPFSLGEVYFNELCYFDDTISHEIIEILKNKTSKKASGGFIAWLKNLFNN